jgi:uncharacterized protein
MSVRGQVIGGVFGDIVVRQKSDTPLEIGELLIAQTPDESILLSVFELAYGSQIAQQQLELISGMQLEESVEPSFFEPQLRNYMMAHLKSMLAIKHGLAVPAKNLPSFFSTVRAVTAADFSFLPKKGFSIGKLRSGSRKVDVDIYLDPRQVLSHHVLIPATTGKGKSNLMSTLLWNLLTDPHCAMLVFDPHDEYIGRSSLGLKDHPSWSSHGLYYTAAKSIPGSVSLKIHLSYLRPYQFHALDFTQPQHELMSLYASQYGDGWIEAILLKKPLSFNFLDGTYDVVKRRLCRLLDLTLKDGVVVCSGIYSNNAGLTTIDDIAHQLEGAKTVIVDTSTLQGQSELLLSSVITSHVFDTYREYRRTGQLSTKPVISVVLEEAPRVLGKDVLDKGSNIFSTIAREGRKFSIGLIAITQLPSLIPKDILANMNTKIVLGIEMAAERQAIIESAAQDLSTENRAIASLDKGEAIITSNFTRFAVPIAIPLFSDIAQVQKSSQPLKLTGIK